MNAWENWLHLNVSFLKLKKKTFLKLIAEFLFPASNIVALANLLCEIFALLDILLIIRPKQRERGRERKRGGKVVWDDEHQQ